MRNLTIVLSAGVVAALVVYAGISIFEVVGMLHSDVLTMRLGTLIGIFACMGFGAAALALLLRWAFEREDRDRYRELDQRLTQIEGGAPRRN